MAPNLVTRMKLSLNVMFQSVIIALCIEAFVWEILCSGAEVSLNVGVRRLQNGNLNGRLYVTGKYLAFRCEVLPGGQHSLTKEGRIALGHTFVSLGLFPTVTISNSTWSQTFAFDSKDWDSEEGEWKLVLPRSSFSVSDELCEEWIVSVQLNGETRLLQHKSVLLDFNRVPVLMKDFGTAIKHSDDTGDRKFVSCSFGQSACSPDVLVAVCETEQNDFLFGVTHGAFNPGTTLWSRLDLCTVAQDCENLHVVDVVLSPSHILLLTNEGIIAGSLEEKASQVVFAGVEVAGAATWAQWKFVYNPLCPAGIEATKFGDVVFLMPQPSESGSLEAAPFWAVPPYRKWTPVNNLSPKSGSWVLASYDLQTNHLIAVVHEEKKMKLEVHTLSVLASPSDVKASVTPIMLPQDFRLNGICFHPVTKDFYLFGNQILMSSDNGASFDCLVNLDLGERASSCHPSPRENWLVFLTSRGRILFTLSGHGRVIPLPSIHQLPTTLFIDALGNLLEVISGPNHQLIAKRIDVENGIKMSEPPLREIFSIHFILPHEVLVCGYNGNQLKSMDGTILRSKSSKDSFSMKKSLSTLSRGTGRCSEAALIRRQFDTEFKPYCDIEVTLHSEKLLKMLLTCNSNTTQGWSIEDTGKTIISKDCTLSLLILTIQNDSEAVGIQNLPSFPKVENDTSVFLPHSQWEVFDTRLYSHQITPADNLYIHNSDHTAALSNSSKFEFQLAEHFGLHIVSAYGTAIISAVPTSRVVALASDIASFPSVLNPGEWALVNPAEAPRWRFSEETCLHVLQPDGEASLHPVRYLDLGSSFTFTVVASSMDQRIHSNRKLMRVTLSNPDLVELKTEIRYDQHNSEILRVAITHAAIGMGTTALTVFIPSASLRCKDTSFTITFHCSCPPSKHLHFIYSPPFSEDVFLYGNPKDQLNRPLLQNLEVNYRPPSTRGKEVPTSDNIYNADPSSRRRQERYDVSKTSGFYKQCFGKTSREECGCTRELKLSSLAKNSDCRERAHRLIHVGKVTLKFVIREAEKDDIPVQEPMAITLMEVNHRIDYEVSAPSSPSLDHMEGLFSGGSKLLNSTAVLLTLTGSGLYHFKAKVATGFSYCDLQDEFQYYVDLPPLASPTPTIVIAAVSLLMGGAFFLWYLQFLSAHPQCHGRLQGMRRPSGTTN